MGEQNDISTLDICQVGFIKLNILAYDSTILFLGIHPREMKFMSIKKVYNIFRLPYA